MPSEAEMERAARLLTRMHRVLSHDLPNQIVALQSLLHLLELDEADRLSDEGRECLRRLKRVTQKTAGQARFLKEMGRLGTGKPAVATISLGTVVREVENELRQQLPSATVHCRVAGDVQPFAADPRRLVLACMEITRCLLERFPTIPCVLRLSGRARADGIDLDGELTLADDATGNIAPPRPRLMEQCEIVLAEELLAFWGSRLSNVCEEKDSSRFTVIVSASTGHG